MANLAQITQLYVIWYATKRSAFEFRLRKTLRSRKISLVIPLPGGMEVGDFSMSVCESGTLSLSGSLSSFRTNSLWH